MGTKKKRKKNKKKNQLTNFLLVWEVLGKTKGMRFICNGALYKIVTEKLKTNSVGYGHLYSHLYNMDIGPKRVGVSIFSLDMETIRPFGFLYKFSTLQIFGYSIVLLDFMVVFFFSAIYCFLLFIF